MGANRDEGGLLVRSAEDVLIFELYTSIFRGQRRASKRRRERDRDIWVYGYMGVKFV
jgi:hypothetical protein